MAKENVGKFYEKLAQDAALAEKLNALDKDFAEKNEGSADDAAMREKAVEAIVLPLAKEVGLPFTLEELKEYEQEQLKEMNLSEDELDQVAGGHPGRHGQNGGGLDSSNGLNACAYLGVGLGQTKKNGKYAFCIILGGSDGPVAG
ncbi:Nif11 family protein [Anaerovibrio sp. RM50]|uniref:Nif11 family protein n=1 Tax=Anaerovibrio sp. RM50 TaxID=1200557 RepID=UPI0004867BF9|nr:Nif11 family protein [Anaerovibrio sp. RM50]